MITDERGSLDLPCNLYSTQNAIALDFYSHNDYIMNQSNFVTIKQLGELAKACREEAGLNQNEVASLIGTSQSNVSAAESGKSTRYATVAIRIIEALGQKTVKGPFFLLLDVYS